jgi:hypothetical protein
MRGRRLLGAAAYIVPGPYFLHITVLDGAGKPLKLHLLLTQRLGDSNLAE